MKLAARVSPAGNFQYRAVVAELHAFVVVVPAAAVGLQVTGIFVSVRPFQGGRSRRPRLGAGPAAIAFWAKCNGDWLNEHLTLPYGIPSRDTFRRVLQRLKPQAFQHCFSAWLESLIGPGGAKFLAIDGKTLRRSHDGKHQLGALHMVSVWATEERLTLGQIATAAKSNEITAIPLVLGLVDVEGAIVTIDAMGCQKEITAHR